MPKLWTRFLPVFLLLLAACGGAPTASTSTTTAPAPSSTTAPAASSVPAPSSTTNVSAATAAPAAATAAAADDPAALPWDQVVAKAKGSTVNMFMWGGDDNINRYINEFVAQQLKTQYDITLKQTPLGDTVEAVNKVLGEKTAGKTSDGSIDLIWINGENFRTMRQGKLLYGPWSQQIPNAALIPWDQPGVANDFGYPVEGYEAPWGRAQFVFIYDSARVPDPPKSFKALLEWAKAHPGRFTYPAPPRFHRQCLRSPRLL